METYLAGRHELEVKAVYVSGDPYDPADADDRMVFGSGAGRSAAREA
ncbi:MAG: hypothetical protein LBG27_01165 [Spirochaetaceae bacterium]|nr:hypothetical protein [Spirochaetaceae bacterium]